MSENVIDRIVEQNVGVYRASASRLQEDVSQEAQVADDYRGRLVYELLQNADDAMEGQATSDDRVAFVITDTELWMANSGRALTAADVQGLCGLGASSKVDAGGSKRASIGHKGLGFKSVLEVTGTPAAYSDPFCFELGVDHARRWVNPLWEELGKPPPARVPAMRFPAAITDDPLPWSTFRSEGFKTAFRFPFKPTVTVEQRHGLADLLLGLQLTTVLFLKHLESVEVVVDQTGRQLRRRWTVARAAWRDDRWVPCEGLRGSGLFRVTVASDTGDAATFLIAHDADVTIGPNRVGLSGPAWEGVDLTEVSIAVLDPDPAEARDEPMPHAWRQFHVFLPTEEHCPYPLLVNGAFATDLSRQHVRVSTEAGDYNSHVVRQAARLFRHRLLPALVAHGTERVLEVLDRGATLERATTAAQLLHDAIEDELAGVPLLPLESGELIAIESAVLPPSLLAGHGAAYRQALPRDASWGNRLFPDAAFCAGRWAAVIADHGAISLSAVAALEALAALADGERTRFLPDDSGGFELDPVLELCAEVWNRVDPEDRLAVEGIASTVRLFPIAVDDDGRVERVVLGDDTAFYPPRSARQELPLTGLRFMCHSLCWGALLPKERTEYLEDRMKAWGALFDVREFRFEEVMRAAVIPALVLTPDEEALSVLRGLERPETLAAICQLAGAQVKPDRPLRYQRLESDRALFNLSRLPVPCRAVDDGVEWVPAYQVYFGKDWIGSASVEAILDALPPDDPAREGIQFHFLASPGELRGLLQAFSSDQDDGPDHADEDDPLDEEVGVDEDTDQALEGDEIERWIAFLSWIGVNQNLRLVHFHDVMDDATGWLKTKNLEQPRGWAFLELGDLWTTYIEPLQQRLEDDQLLDGVTPYLYEIHDLDQIGPLLGAAARDETATVGAALFAHLARHWGAMVQRSVTQVALVPTGKWPSSRSIQRALPDEIHQAGDDLWILRLRRAGFLPTTRGPRVASTAWYPSPEVERRFGRHKVAPGHLLPVVDVDPLLPPAEVRAVAERLGARTDLSPSTFTIDDALLLCERLEAIYGPGGLAIDAAALRATIKPVYRQLFELLSGRQGDPALAGALRDAPLLTQQGSSLSFHAAHEVIYARTPGVRERSGVTGHVATFVLEAEPGANAPLSTVFGVRVLEDVLDWQPSPGEPALDQMGLSEFRRELRSLVPQLLARIRAERIENQDAIRLADLVDRIEPVESLAVSCRLDGHLLNESTSRSYFVSRNSQQREPAFVVWGSEAWPPISEGAQGLAMAIADTLGINLVESFLAFIQGDETQRLQLLDLAGARGYLAEIEGELSDPEPDDSTDPEQLDGALDQTPAPDSEQDTDAAPQPPAKPGPAAPPVQLVSFDTLVMDGDPITVFGETPTGSASSTSNDGRDGTGSGSPAGGSGAGSSSAAAPGVDIDAQDLLGTRIALAYEGRRLQRLGLEPVVLVAPDEIVSGASFVVDAHDPRSIRAAEEASPVVKQVFLELESAGLSRQFPGFDILTIADGKIDRLIELKSSSIDAQVQTMSWNEWKTAATSSVRSRFWLYLVGNLRADLPHAAPYVRCVHDPFGTLSSKTVEDRQTRRAVQLRVREFTQAEHLDLLVEAAPD